MWDAIRMAYTVFGFIVWDWPIDPFANHWVPLYTVPAHLVAQYLRAHPDVAHTVLALLDVHRCRDIIHQFKDVVLMPPPGHIGHTHTVHDPRYKEGRAIFPNWIEKTIIEALDKLAATVKQVCEDRCVPTDPPRALVKCGIEVKLEADQIEPESEWQISTDVTPQVPTVGESQKATASNPLEGAGSLSFIDFLHTQFTGPELSPSCQVTGSVTIRSQSSVSDSESVASVDSFIDDASYAPETESDSHSECMVDASEFDRLDYILSD